MSIQQDVEGGDVARVRRYLVFLGCALVAVGQVFMYTTPVNENMIAPSSWWIDACGLLVFLCGVFYRPIPFIQKAVSRLKVNETASWIVAAIFMSALAILTMTQFQKYDRTNYTPVVTFWLFAGACYVAAFWKKKFSRQGIAAWFKTNWRELLAVTLITLLGLALRFYRLGEVPRVVNGDEGVLGSAALSTVRHPLANPFALWANFGAFYLHIVNLFFYWFGVSPFSLRLLPAIGGTLAIPMVYLLARQIGGARIAIISSSLLAISHTHLHFSRTAAVGYIQGTWLAPLELYLLLSGLEKRSAWRTALAGVILGIHFTVYLTAQVMLGLILVYLLILVIFFWSWFKQAARPALVFWGGFIVSFLPEGFYILRQPGEFFNRLNQDGTFQSSWLPQRMAETGQGVAQILFERVVHAFLTIIYYPSIDFYGSSVPMLSLLTAVLFLLGLVIVFFKARDRGFLLLNGYFWAGTLAVGIFALPPTADSYRMLIVLPPALVMAAVGFDQLLEFLGLSWGRSRKAYSLIFALLSVSLLFFNLSTYYIDFAGRCLYGGDPMTRFASYLGNYLHNVPAETEVFLLSDGIYRYGTHPSVDFLSGGKAIVNFDASAADLAVNPGDVVIASPERIAELKQWARLHPGGELKEQLDCSKMILLAYKLP